MADELATFMQKERAEVDALLAEIEAKRAKLDEEEALLARRIAALEAYEAVLAGKELVVKQARKPRARRGPSRRAAVLEIIQKHPNGIDRAGIIEALGAKGDASAEQSISNVLTALKKAKEVGNTAGKYIAAPA